MEKSEIKGNEKNVTSGGSLLDEWLSTNEPILPEPILKFAKRALAPDFDRRIELIMKRYHSDEFDPFGFDFNFAVYVVLIAGLVYRYYFRVKTIGIEKLPQGPFILVANHSGQIPIDGAMIATGLMLDSEEPRLLRSMVEKWAATLPFINTFFSRCGQIVGKPENINLLLSRGEAVLVFPEGSKGIVKPFSRAYILQEFGMGFMRVALTHHCPVVPVAVIGAEEQYPSLANLERIAKALRMPGLPLPIQSLIPFAFFLPLPTKYRIYFGEPMTFKGNPDDDDGIIEEKVRVVRRTIQTMIQKGLEERKHIFW